MKSLADTINKCIEKYMILRTPASVILGLVLNEKISMAQLFVPYLFGWLIPPYSPGKSGNFSSVESA